MGSWVAGTILLIGYTLGPDKCDFQARLCDFLVL
jgi:hypothetical protein